MNESTLLKLKVIVERAVRPVKATASQKMKMREEMLNHVIGVFDEEFAQCGDEDLALLQSQTRFGNPDDIAQQLRESIPIRGRLDFFEERLFMRQQGETLTYQAGRCAFWSMICLFGIEGIVLFANGRFHASILGACLLGLFNGVVSLMLFAILLLADATRIAVQRRSYFGIALLFLLTTILSYVPVVVIDWGYSALFQKSGHLWHDWDVSVFLGFPTVVLFLVAILAGMKARLELKNHLAEEWTRLQVD